MTLEEKVRWSVRILRSYQPKNEPYYVCYSGGKDKKLKWTDIDERKETDSIVEI